ncbi:MAG TPA: hypothetical protein VK766_10840 [Cytophagaceae bacterium]|nr:hypothetical protein [Cytophagaceae bacterium]
MNSLFGKDREGFFIISLTHKKMLSEKVPFEDWIHIGFVIEKNGYN